MSLKLVKLAACLAAIAICASAAETSKPVSPALDFARQLNQAFIEVADQVSPAVVVIKVAQKQSRFDLEDEDSPLWEMLPPQFRRQLERQREKQRQETKDSDGE